MAKKSIKQEIKIWECECGHRENSSECPDECQKCLQLDSFSQLPHELVLESSLTPEVDDDN